MARSDQDQGGKSVEHDERKCVDACLREWLREHTAGLEPGVVEAASIAALDVIEDAMSVDGGDWRMPGDGR